MNIKIYLALIIMFAALGCGPTGKLKSPEVTLKYDKFENQTIYESSKSKVYGKTFNIDTHFIDTHASASCPKKKVCNPENYLIYFTSQSEGWRLLEYYELYFMIDGERYKFLEEDIYTDRDVVYGGNVREFFSISVTRNFFHRLANARSVQAKIGHYELTMSSEKRIVYKLLAEKTTHTYTSN